MANTIEYEHSDIVKAMAESLIKDHHKRLQGANIAYVLRLGPWQNKGQLTLGSAKKCSALEKFLTGYDFIMQINSDAWYAANGVPNGIEWRKGLIDHELMHMGKNEEGDWTTYPHDYTVFKQEIVRHGAWKEDMRELIEAAVAAKGQMSFLGQGGQAGPGLRAVK